MIPDAAIEAAKTAMETVTPPPGASKSDWLAEHGRFALIAGAIAAASPHIRAQALEDAADIAGRPENRWWAEGRNRAKWLRDLAAAERGSK